jgi:hypothetical protein
MNPVFRPFFLRYAAKHGSDCVNVGHLFDCLLGWLYRGRIDRWEFLAAVKVWFHHGTIGDLRDEWNAIALRRAKEEDRG